MPELIKDKYYNYNSLSELAFRLKDVYPSFQADKFVSDVMDDDWDALELKARVRRISINLGKYLPSEYEQAIGVIDNVVASYPDGYNDYSLDTSRTLLKSMGRMSAIGICQYPR